MEKGTALKAITGVHKEFQKAENLETENAVSDWGS